MKVMRSYKYKLRTTESQSRRLRSVAGSCRFVFNKALTEYQENYRMGNKFLGYVATAKLLTGWRHNEETGWLSQAPIHPLQQSLRDLESAFKNFFAKRAGFPKFKKKGAADSFRFPAHFKVDQDNNRVYLPKIGWIRYHNSRRINGKIRSVTVMKSGVGWFISVLIEKDMIIQTPLSAIPIGIDVGINKLVTLSDGTVFMPTNSHKRYQEKLSRYQQIMARRQNPSNNREKIKAKMQKLHTRIAQIRKDYLHKITTAISKNHAIVCIEDLKILNMYKPVHGAKKTRLNRAIADQGWSEIRRQLEYKIGQSGGKVIAVPAYNTSRKCPACGHTSANNRKSQANFVCMACGYENNADVVGALNILAAGHAVLACGEIAQQGFSVKQEPAEVI